MKDESDKRSNVVKFEDDVAVLIDSACADLTIAEVVGVLELNLHILKCRYYPVICKSKE